MDSIEKQLSRIATTDDGKARKKVVVIGTGMAGLSSAFELIKMGHKVILIEATNRVGGRVWTHKFKDGQYHELGAMRIPANHDYTRYYIAQSGLSGRLRPFITAHGNRNCFYYMRGKVAQIKDAPNTILNQYNLSTLERRVAESAVAPAIFGAHLANTLRSLTEEDRESLFGGTFQTDRVQELERQSLGEYLERRLESQDAKELIGATTGLEVWWGKSVSMFLRDEIIGTGEGLEEISGGMSSLPEALTGLIGRNLIRFNTEVLSIELQQNAVKLSTRSTNPNEWDCPPLHDAKIDYELADFVICTIPFGVLRRMNLIGFSDLKMRAIRNLSYASSTKVLLHCKVRFWETGTPEERIIGGASLSDQITRSTYYPSDHAAITRQVTSPQKGLGFRGISTIYNLEEIPLRQDFTSDPGPGVLVGSYSWGADARRIGALPINERAATVIDVLSKFHKDIKSHVTDCHSMFWDDYRWSRGAFCFMEPGDLKSYYHASIRPEGRVHFAGEHCSLDQAWIQGAIMSGLRAVEEIVGI